MTWPIEELRPRLAKMNLATGRISEGDASRQTATIAEVIKRLGAQPGIILADEVGMGKTFVALGVATIAALADKGRRPVVIMVPSSLQKKWPRDFDVFRGKCLSEDLRRDVTFRCASSALEFFRLIDDPVQRRPRIIFLTHGAFHVSSSAVDVWVRLALVKRAMHGLHLGERRTALPRFAASLFRAKSTHTSPELFDRLLGAPYEVWKEVINTFYSDRSDLQEADDPIPEALRRVLRSADLEVEHLRECVRRLPARWSDSIEGRVADARAAVNDALRHTWPKVIAAARFKSPLLILDEAHHLKNPSTRLASLFGSKFAEEEVNEVCGTLNGAFERMLFLTATPFQLGHYELLSVLSRFRGIWWKSLPSGTLDQFEKDKNKLQALLDTAQLAAADLDRKWQLLDAADLRAADGTERDPEEWWNAVLAKPLQQSERVQMVYRAFELAKGAMKAAEMELRTWVVRHLRNRKLPQSQVDRRVRLSGQSIIPGKEAIQSGLSIENDAILPFLLAARAQSAIARNSYNCNASSRATFAEGLASSYEAFLETSKTPGEALDEVEGASEIIDGPATRYLRLLTGAIPNPDAYSRHPKIRALVERVLELWSLGEKVVVFCHFRKTGRALVRHISVAVKKKLWEDAARRLGVSASQAEADVKRFAARFDQGEPMQRYLEAALNSMMTPHTDALCAEERDQIQDVVRRFVRTPLFVARYFDVAKRASPDLLEDALKTADQSGVSLRNKLEAFVYFIAKRCEPTERFDYLDALGKVHPGLRDELPEDRDDGGSDVELLPNIRLANGTVRQDSRQRMMLSFNTPFFPEILVASSVLAEGVDLHLNCRYVIHYDLCWNPSTLEQRTGRVDRMGAKAETVGKSIEIFLPYLAGTQDEKTYRVVMDRERWFQVLMGEKYPEDEAAARQLAARVPLPLCAAEQLAFKLSII